MTAQDVPCGYDRLRRQQSKPAIALRVCWSGYRSPVDMVDADPTEGIFFRVADFKAVHGQLARAPDIT